MLVRHVGVVGCAMVLIGFVACGGAGSSAITDTGVGLGDAGGDGSSASAEGGNGNGNGNGNGSGVDGGGPGGNTTSVPCGTATCSLATQVCCVVRSNGATVYQCANGSCSNPDAGLPTGGNGGGGGGNVTSLKCTAQANCAMGSICCIRQAGGGGQGGVASECVVGTTCPGNGAQLCDPSATPTGCPAGGGKDTMCSSNNIGDWGLSAPFATCGGVGR